MSEFEFRMTEFAMGGLLGLCMFLIVGAVIKLIKMIHSDKRR